MVTIFPDYILKCIFLKEKFHVLIQISKFIPNAEIEVSIGPGNELVVKRQ